MRRLEFLMVLGVCLLVCGHAQENKEAQPNGAEKVKGKVTAPRVTHAPDPHYSKEGRKKNIQGVVVLWMTVNEDGTPSDIHVVRSLGYGLDEEAMKAVEKWRFEPAKRDGKPVRVNVNVEVNFRR